MSIEHVLFDYEIGTVHKAAVCACGFGATVSPLLRLIVNGIKINVFVRFPPGPAENNWIARIIIISICPDTGRVKECHALENVLGVRAAGDQDLLVTGKLLGALPAT